MTKQEQESQKNKPDAKHQVDGLVIPAHAQLMRFYDVDNYHDLVDEQDRHIQRLQRKLPPLREPITPGNPRRG